MDSGAAKLRKFAQRLLAIEAAAGPASGDARSAAFHVCEKLRRSLSKLAGAAGFRSLLTRALALAQREAPWLKAVRVRSDGGLEGLEEAEANLAASEIARGEAHLVAQLIGLLATFIGEPLALQLVREAWPEDPLSDVS